MSSPRVAILGSGASGAFAYQACKYCNIEPEIFTAQMGKPSAGAFYFHWLPPAVEELAHPKDILWTSVGTEEVYLAKQWGSHAPDSSSFPAQPRVEIGYDPQEVWEILWKDANIDLVAGSFSDTDILDFSKYYDLVFHTFPSQESLRDQLPPVTIPIEKLSRSFKAKKELVGDYENYIIYGGSAKLDWVRLSSLFGNVFMEYNSHHPFAKGGDNIELRRDMHPDTQPWKKLIWKNIVPLGRLAKWNRSELSHQAFWDTYWCINVWAQGVKDFREMEIGIYDE